MIDTEIRIGKNILENLTTGMYTDSRFIYREYIQNAADAVDEAIKQNIVSKEDALINIEIDANERNIVIYDNGTGINSGNVNRLLDIADSTKDKDTNKGFRGIGRLGGLAYCSELIFETSAKGESIKTILTWNAKLLQEVLMDSADKSDVVSLVKRIANQKQEKEDIDKHYFKVVLKCVNQSNNQLLDVEDVRNYLSLVAPVPFEKTKFYMCSKIYDFVKNNNLRLDEYNIRINDENLYKAYIMALYDASDNTNNKKRYDEIHDIEFEKFYTNDGELLGWSWIGISKFEKNIPEKNNPTKGIRLKKQNIQFGNAQTLSPFHNEGYRGNGYFIGEVHAIHKKLIPNARRDYFNENKTLNEFETALKAYFSKIYKYYRYANDYKNAQKSIIDLQEKKIEFSKREKEGFIDAEERNSYLAQIDMAEKRASEAQKKIEKLDEKSRNDSSLNTVVNAIKKDSLTSINNEKVNKNNNRNNNQSSEKKIIYRADNLNKLNRNERKLVGDIYKIIYTVLDPDTASSLINKIEEKYK